MSIIYIAQRLCSSNDNSLLQGIFHLLHSRGSTSYNQISNSQQKSIQYATVCVQPRLDYFNRILDSNLKDTLLAFKTARYFSPQRIKNIQPEVEAINSLKAFLFLDLQTVLNGLKQELPLYLAKEQLRQRNNMHKDSL